jgi:hypothetical protein
MDHVSGDIDRLHSSAISQSLYRRSASLLRRRPFRGKILRLCNLLKLFIVSLQASKFFHLVVDRIGVALIVGVSPALSMFASVPPCPVFANQLTPQHERLLDRHPEDQPDNMIAILCDMFPFEVSICGFQIYNDGPRTAHSERLS